MLGKMVISLDFELLYGLSDLDGQDHWKKRVLGGREAISDILDLFKQYDIHATWAVVGMLFAKNKDDLFDHLPDTIPSYTNHNYHLDIIGQDESIDPLHYAKSLICKIRETPHQEIASHTFSHFYCMECGQTVLEFESDLRAAIKIALENGIEIRSIVFPRNQIRDEYVSILKKHGIVAYRGNERSPLYSGKTVKENIMKRAVRLADAYINITGMHCYDQNSFRDNEGIINIPSSRFLRPFLPKFHFGENLKICRIKNQMRYAAKKGKVFHMWWHPHNFGENTQQNLSNLIKILDYYAYLKNKYGFSSMTMQEMAEEVL